MPIQVLGVLVRAPCPVPSYPAYEPNSDSVFLSLSIQAHSSRGGRHCYAIKLENSGRHPVTGNCVPCSFPDRSLFRLGSRRDFFR